VSLGSSGDLSTIPDLVALAAAAAGGERSDFRGAHMDASAEIRRQRRGTKRTCKTCEQRFYDLTRDPTVCPMCKASLPLTSFLAPPEPQRGTYYGSWSRTAPRARPIEVVSAVAPDPEQQLDEGSGEMPTAEDTILEQEDEGESDVSDLLEADEETDSEG
jgi:uncharacterized protein (TIGR02300 family)